VKKAISKKSTFLTGFNEGPKHEFSADDIELVKRWKAHNDLINQVSYVPELHIVATCSFDCNVYMWNKDTYKQVGSLVLGTGASQQSEQTEAERRKYSKIWQIKIDKQPRFVRDRLEAEEMLGIAQEMEYETMFLKGTKEKEAYEAQKKQIEDGAQE